MSVTSEEHSELSNRMADALARIDPNTKNGNEGMAFIRRMYKMLGKKDSVVLSKPFMPQTPELCVDIVAGKVIQVQDLQEELDKKEHFNKFFANLYCQAYENALVTTTDGLSMIFPGSLDGPIESSIENLYGERDGAEKAKSESLAIESFIDAVTDGAWVMDYTTLINPGQPLAEALAICPKSVEDEIEMRKVEREDYFNDFNFLKYLNSL